MVALQPPIDYLAQSATTQSLEGYTLEAMIACYVISLDPDRSPRERGEARLQLITGVAAQNDSLIWQKTIDHLAGFSHQLTNEMWDLIDGLFPKDYVLQLYRRSMQRAFIGGGTKEAPPFMVAGLRPRRWYVQQPVAHDRVLSIDQS